jgi:hypothetical protein
MSNAELANPIFDQGIRSVNFFNGRLLSAEDLSREQAAGRESRRRFAQAIGDGVAYGFEVERAAGSGTKAVVTIQPGLAINRKGDVLQLPVPVNLSLVRPETGGPASGGNASFDACTPFQSGVYVTGAGVYLLTVSPAQGREGRATVSGLQNAAAGCNTKYLVDGVQFRLIQLDFTAAELGDSLRLRNLVAFRCFGVTTALAGLADPFGPPLDQYGLLDELRPNRLTDCSVPLAVVLWTAEAGLGFIDLWSVRRKPTQNRVLSDWPSLVSERRSSEAEAMLLQFEDHIQDLRVSETSPASLVANRRFGYLPAAGLLPVATRAAPSGFNPIVFFGERSPSKIAIMESDSLRDLLHESFYHEPIGLGASEPIQLYAIWENLRAFEAGATIQPAVVFAKHTLRYRGVSKFGRASWSLDRFTSTVI